MIAEVEPEMSRILTLVGRLTAVSCCVAALSGCFVPAMPAEDNRADMSPEDLIGVWQNTDMRVLVFEEGGSFVANGLPREMFDGLQDALPRNGRDPSRGPLVGSGWWSLEPSHVDRDGPTSNVALHFRILANSEASTVIRIRAEQVEESTVLVYYAGDPDLNRRIVYERCYVDCPTATPRPTG